MADLDLLLEREPSSAVQSWIDLCLADMKAEYEVPKIPRDDHEAKDAYDELVTMRGTDEGIIPVVLPEARK